MFDPTKFHFLTLIRNLEFVRPHHHEYAPAVWYPHLNNTNEQLDNVQRRAKQMVKGFQIVREFQSSGGD